MHILDGVVGLISGLVLMHIMNCHSGRILGLGQNSGFDHEWIPGAVGMLLERVDIICGLYCSFSPD